MAFEILPNLLAETLPVKRLRVAEKSTLATG